MILSFAITGVSAQKIEWKYSTPNNYWETEKNINGRILRKIRVR